VRSSRIYLTQTLTNGESITLEGDSFHYLSRVLRLKIGDKFNPFNGDDGEFSAEINSLERNQLTATINNPVDNNADSKLEVNLGLGLSRGERMDYGIQKATELGVSAITPITTTRSEVKLSQDRQANKLQHWQKVAINASEQCGRNTVPQICTPSSLTNWVQENRAGIVLDHRGAGNIANQTIESPVNLLIGAEGGLTEEELEFAKQHEFRVFKLGPRILRTETAPIVALTLLQMLAGDI
jgi:16S rRNA (uracil1498-N3)-methyltransferase